MNAYDCAAARAMNELPGLASAEEWAFAARFAEAKSAMLAENDARILRGIACPVHAPAWLKGMIAESKRKKPRETSQGQTKRNSA